MIGDPIEANQVPASPLDQVMARADQVMEETAIAADALRDLEAEADQARAPEPGEIINLTRMSAEDRNAYLDAQMAASLAAATSQALEAGSDVPAAMRLDNVDASAAFKERLDFAEDAGSVQEAYVQGVSTRRVDDLVKALGMNGISKSQVSRLCQALDTEVERFRTRKLDGQYPFCWLDATFLKVRQEHRVVSMAVVIAVGVFT
jgi:hypothetical protein